jgi:hypothetical protein
MNFKKIKKLHIITTVVLIIGLYYFVNNIEEGLKGKKKKKHPAKKKKHPKKHPKKKQQGPKCICPTPPTMGTTMFNYLPSSVKILMGKYTPAFIKTPIKQMFT